MTASLHQARREVPPAKRRRVRKGTKSCWECKRRKIRCLFKYPDDITCIGCQRRRTTCVSQEIPEDPSAATRGNRQLGDRVARIEDALKEFLGAGSDLTPFRPSDLVNLTPAESAEGPTPQFPSLVSSPNADQEYAEPSVIKHLLAALPVPEDIQILFREGARPSLYTELANTQPRSKLTLEILASIPPPPSGFPGTNPHPVLLVKQMLLFAITLQCPCGDEILGLSEPPSVMKRCLTAAATRWLTNSDKMQQSADSLICIILEGVFETNAGNLRRAWVVYRRALTAAQLMGLHLFPKPSLPRIDPRLEVDSESLWFRIVYMDRYLSLLLGLPRGTSDQTMTIPATLQDETPLGLFERHLTSLASRILDRNQTPSAPSLNNNTTTQAIDAELLAASQLMPASFWRPANFQHLTTGSPEALLETLRLGAQIYYHGLLVHLHLPHMLDRVSDQEDKYNKQQQYSKSTCSNASREIITRFVAHRTFNPMSSCSRPVDFFALLAAMTLLLAHLEAHHHPGAIDNLAHQRLTDRGILDQALERLDVLSHLNNDATSRQAAALIRRLLDIEADTAEGNQYTARSASAGTDVGWEPKADELRLQIPHLGIIRITRQGPISREPWLEQEISQTSLDWTESSISSNECESSLAAQVPPAGASTDNEPPVLQSQYSASNLDKMFQQPGTNDWIFQGVDVAFFDSLMKGTPGVDTAGSGSQL
ncbi:hypothetical protein BDV06DRAFT_212810 [Aspergillus oleicola]